MTDHRNPYGIQVSIGPGGLSATAHLVNVIIALMTCGLWLPIYLIIALTTSPKTVQVSAPIGTPQAAIDAAYAEAAALTPEERAIRNRQFLAVGIVAGGLMAVCLGAWILGQFGK